mgnify:CR=1 FL=1
MKKILASIAAAALCLSLSACGGNSQPASSSALSYTYKDQTISMKAAPSRIVTLSAPLINMAYAVGGTSIARPETTSPIPEEAKWVKSREIKDISGSPPLAMCRISIWNLWSA